MAMTEVIPGFALSYSEQARFTSETGVRLLRRAAQTIYASEKYQHRGEFGELLLHMVLTEFFGTQPAISKLFFKDSANDTVKGFDSVHVADVNGDLELWLGEVKFYEDLDSAIRDVIAELEKHAAHDYLRSEFLAIANKIDPAWPHADALRRMLDEDTSLDAIFRRLRVPVLLTYDSKAVQSHTSYDDPYRERFVDEVTKGHAKFSNRERPADLTVNLILVPLQQKRELVRRLDERLRAWQRI